MFLALKELKYSKSKFILIMTVIFLISYLVYFLTSLANELATSYTNSINNKTDYKGKYDIWQYTSKGNIAGINGNVDLNIVFETLKNDIPELLKSMSD